MSVRAEGAGDLAEVTIAGSISVDLPRVATAEEAFQQVLYAFQAELDGLDAKLRAGLAEWAGDARDAYRVAHAQWQAAANDMAKALAWLHGVIGTAGGNYQSARTANLSMWGH